MELTFDQYNREMIEAFVGKPKEFFWYKKAFKKFENDSSKRWYWCWWAFFVGPIFFLYRKAYLPFFILSMLILVNFLFESFLGIAYSIIGSILTGGFSSYFIFKQYQKRRNIIETEYLNNNERIEIMSTRSGCNEWINAIFVGLFILFSLGCIYILIMKKL